MIKLKTYFFLGLLLLATLSCEKDESICCDVAVSDEIVTQQVKDFFWRAMNIHYYWQADVPALSDNIASSADSLTEFLESFESPEELFDSLIHEDDRFSWMVDDYIEQEKAFQGITTSFGYEFGLFYTSYFFEETELASVVGIVRYVVPNSPADNAGLKRGDLFTEVDGIQLTSENFRTLLYNNPSYTLTLAKVEDGILLTTDEKVSLTSVNLTENPIHLHKIIELGNQRIGYLSYNQFVNNDSYLIELNSIFGEFISEGVSELVLDLRYNLGGSVYTTLILASMIYKNASANDLYGSVEYNQKVNEAIGKETRSYYFKEKLASGEALNRLDLNRIFVLTSKNTASASEFIIAGLMPFMDVTLIGTKTRGKNQASRTLYDSPKEAYTSKGNDLNPNHTYALQPIIGKLANSVGFKDYEDGFEPTIELNEIQNLATIKPLGDPEEVLLSQALKMIEGVVARQETVINYVGEEALVGDSFEKKKTANITFVDSNLFF